MARRAFRETESDRVLIMILEGDWNRVAKYCGLSVSLLQPQKAKQIARFFRLAMEIALERDRQRLELSKTR